MCDHVLEQLIYWSLLTVVGAGVHFAASMILACSWAIFRAASSTAACAAGFRLRANLLTLLSLPFRAGWGSNVVGLLLDADSDWDEIAELLTDSYCLLAPARLAAQVPRPG